MSIEKIIHSKNSLSAQVKAQKLRIASSSQMDTGMYTD